LANERRQALRSLSSSKRWDESKGGLQGLDSLVAAYAAAMSSAVGGTSMPTDEERKEFEAEIDRYLKALGRWLAAYKSWRGKMGSHL
jgi:hypothetical protein